MKIAVIIPEMASLGGGQKFVSEVSRIWEKKHEVSIHTLYWNRKNWDMDNVSAQKESEKTGSAFNLYAPFLMKGLEKQASADAYNTHLFPANWFSKKPNVWYAHDPPRLMYDLRNEVLSGLGPAKKLALAAYLPILRQLDLRESLRNVDSFVGNSEYCASYLQKVYGKKAQFVYPGVDAKKFKPAKPQGSDLLTVARLHSAKRVDLCINAMALVTKKFPDAKLRVAGEGPERKKLEALAKKLGLDQKVSFLGPIDAEQLAEEYKNAFAVLYLPMREPFGLVPLEAGAAGKPVIAVNEGGCKETVINGRTGLLTGPNKNEVAAAAIRLLDDRKLAEKMGTEGRKRAKTFSWKKTAKELLQILKDNAQ